MAQHPFTPPPHRFLQNKQTHRKAAPSLRNAHSAAAPSPTQFLQTPRFTLPPHQAPSSSSSISTQSPAFFSTPFQRPNPQRESIESPPSSPAVHHSPSLPIRSPARKRVRVAENRNAILISSSPEESGDQDTNGQGVTPPTTPPRLKPLNEAARSPISPTEIVQDGPPSLTTAILARPTPAFKIPHARTQGPLQTQGQAQSQVSSTAMAPPLLPPHHHLGPELSQSAFFSPTRKGERYVPGGLARSVRDWVIEASNATAAVAAMVVARDVEKVGGKGWLVHEAQGTRGEEDALEEEDSVRQGQDEQAERDDGAGWLLIRQEEKEGERDVVMVVGSEVEIRRPTWSVRIGERMWNVGVEWTVVRNGRGTIS